MKHPIGAFLGALVFVLLQTFAIDLIDRERFNLVIGVVFLAIVLFSPDGLLGLWAKLRSRFGPNPARGALPTKGDRSESEQATLEPTSFCCWALQRPRRWRVRRGRRASR